MITLKILLVFLSLEGFYLSLSGYLCRENKEEVIICIAVSSVRGEAVITSYDKFFISGNIHFKDEIKISLWSSEVETLKKIITIKRKKLMNLIISKKERNMLKDIQTP